MEDAVVEKRLVVVAEVPVALTKVKFWRVEEAEVEVAVSQPTVGLDDADIAPVPLP